MAKTYNRLVIDVNQHINTLGIRPVQGDTKSRYLDVSLYENGVAINLTGEQVRINFEKADGTTFFNQGEITDAEAGRCQFALTNEILSEAKVVKAQISIWNTENEILSTEVFTILVTESIRNDVAVESENEFGVLVVLFQEIQNALDLIQAVLDSFGEPGEKAAEYGVATFWGILETLAARTDMETVLKKYIAEALNSTLGTGKVSPLNEMLQSMDFGTISFNQNHGDQSFETTGTHTWQCPEGVDYILAFLASGGGGGQGGHYGGTTTSTKGGGGGGGESGHIIVVLIKVVPGSTYEIVIGEGGSGGAKASAAKTQGESGARGGSTSFGNIVTVIGGAGGSKNNESSSNPHLYGGTGGVTMFKEIMDSSGVFYNSEDEAKIMLCLQGNAGADGGEGGDVGTSENVGGAGGLERRIEESAYPEYFGFTAKSVGGAGGHGDPANWRTDGSNGTAGNVFIKW